MDHMLTGLKLRPLRKLSTITVEVRSSSLLVPTFIFSSVYGGKRKPPPRAKAKAARKSGK
jgi:hypothetical protein